MPPREAHCDVDVTMGAEDISGSYLGETPKQAPSPLQLRQKPLCVSNDIFLCLASAKTRIAFSQSQRVSCRVELFPFWPHPIP